MPTELVLSATHLNQKINNLIFPFYHIFWDNQQKQWHYEENSYHRLYKLTTFLCVTFGLILSLLEILIFTPLGHLTMKEALIAVITAIGVIINLLVDVMIFWYGRDWVNVTNWVYQIEENFFTRYSNRKWRSHENCFSKILSLLKEEIRKILKKAPECYGKPDWPGLLFCYIAIVYPLFAIVVTLLLSFTDLNILYLLFKVINVTIIEQNYFAYILSTILKLFAFHLCAQAILTNCRTCILLFCGMAVSFFNILAKVFTLEPSSATLGIYHTMSIALCQVKDLVDGIIGSFLCLAYVLLIVEINAFIYGMQQDSFEICFTIAFVTIACLCAVVSCFKTGCIAINCSTKGVHLWRMKLQKHGRNLVLKKSALACRELMIRPLGLGLLNENTKLNYFNALLNSTASALLLWKDLL